MVGDLIPRPLLSRKRQEREDESSSSMKKKYSGSSATSTTLNRVLDDLGDDELIQILCRLPTAKLALGVKLVSKHWYSLISHPYFVSQFITHHINNFPNPFGVFISSFQQSQLFRITVDDLIFESRGYALEFLPEERESVSVVASCYDLLHCLIIEKGKFPRKGYICNPLTMQWFLLPPRPAPTTRGEKFFSGLVCEPNYQRWKQGQQYECRFRVVHMVLINNKHYVYTYCSETGQWHEAILLGTQYEPWSNIVAHDGKLHWFNAFGVVVYDPFNCNMPSIIIDGLDSEFMLPSHDCCRVFCVGISQGVVRFVQSVNYMRADDNDNLSVWELEDCASGRLRLKHRIFYKRGNSLVRKFTSKRGHSVRPLACHPNIRDVVYFDYGKFIISCKIQRGELEVIGKALNGIKIYQTKDVLTAVIPCWPTPLPQNAQDL